MPYSDIEVKKLIELAGETIPKEAERVRGLEKRFDEFEAKAARPNYSAGGPTLAQDLWNSPEFKSFSIHGRGRTVINVADFQKKAAILGSGLGYSVPGVIPSERVPGIIPAALASFRIRDLLRQLPTSAGMVDFVRVTSHSAASPAAEGNTKREAAMSFEAVSQKMSTLAHWIPVSKPALQDLAGLSESINTHLIGGLRDAEDEQLVSGDGIGENLHGLAAQAALFDPDTLSGDSYSYIDVLAAAIQQAELSKQRVSGMVLHPGDWGRISRIKDEMGRYILGDPASMTSTKLWSRPVSVTTAMPEGYFLVGAFATSAALYVREDGVVEVSDSHEDYFARNMLAVRCEERLTLAVYRPAAFVYGPLTASPA